MKLGRTDESNPAHWFAFGEERLRATDLLSQHEGTTASSVEALQESVERYLKGYLIAKGWRLKRVHDLKVLVRDAAAFDPDFASFADFADRLTAEFFEQHYWRFEAKPNVFADASGHALALAPPAIRTANGLTPPQAALGDFCQALLNASAFLYTE